MEKSPDKTAIRRTDSGDIESTDKMATIQYREAQHGDIAAMAEIRAGDWGTQEQWSKTIRQYIDCEHHPREAWLLRACFVCVTGDQIVGLIAGHLTRRFDCDGELQWISVRPEYRKGGIAAQLLKRLAAWFMAQGARRVCVDVDPGNRDARRFYKRHGAENLRPHWMVWQDIETALRAKPSSSLS